MNGDGFVDLVLVAYTSFARTAVRVAYNDGTGHFTAGASIDPYRGYRAAIGDIDADGRPDVVGVSAWYPQLADGTFGSPVALPALSGYGMSAGVAVGDITGDGVADVVRTDPPAGTVRVELGVAGGRLGASRTVTLSTSSDLALALGDIDRDGRTDVVLDSSSQAAVQVLYQRPDGTLTGPESSPLSFADNGIHDQVVLADLDRDGSLDVLSAADNLSVLRQVHLDDTGAPGWVRALTPAPHASGVAVRPTVTVTFDRQLDPSSVDGTTVRLVDAPGPTVPATRTYTAATRTIRLTPTDDLSAGGHYEVVVDGLRDTAGDVQVRATRTWFTVAAGGDRFTPVTPARVLDTRVGPARTAPSVPAPRWPST